LEFDYYATLDKGGAAYSSMLMGAASGEVVSLHERGPGGYTVSALTFSRFAYRPRHPSVGRAGSAAASSPAISPSRAHLVYVPGGHVRPAECITALPNRAVYNVSAAEAPRAGCETTASDAPAVQIYAADAHLKSAAPLTSLTADWVVPPLPKSHPIFGSQVVYFWPGFKATAPEMGYPVLQPVLQYGERGRAWALQSWFVDANDRRFPVATAPAVDVQPGDRITSYMSLSADGSTWTVSGTNRESGEDSTLHIAHSRAGRADYDYAMLVNENINVDERCDRMPAAPSLTFTNVTVNGHAKPAWTPRADCHGSPRCDCGNAASIGANGDVTLSWSTDPRSRPSRRASR